MKIGFVLDDRLDKPDGVQQYIKLLGGWLRNNGHEVHYLTGASASNTDLNQHNMSKTVNVSFNKNRMSIPLPASTKNIKEVLQKYQFDVLHVQMPYSPMMAAKIISHSAPQTAVVGTFHILPHGFVSSTSTKLLAAFLGNNKKRFNGVISVSTAAKKFAKTHFMMDSVVLPNVVDLKKFKTAKPFSKYNDKLNIVFLGRFVERKGPKYLLEAYIHMICRNPELASSTRLILCGDGPDRPKLQKKAKTAADSIGADIVFTGFISEQDKPKYLSSAHIAVFPSTGGESFGIVLIEAMAAGAGVVLGGNNPGYGSVLGEESVSLINPKNVNSFADKLKLFLDDPTIHKQMHASQSELVMRFDVETVGPKIVKFYLNTIANINKKSNN